MIEFGSDFHYINHSSGESNTIESLFPSANYYADGRQALIHLYRSQGWERLWVPEYFCYEVVSSLKDAGLELRFYADYPGYTDDSKTLEAIQRNGNFKPTDAILRVNYFGLRSFRSTKNLSVAAIVEDHTHDLIGTWARHSTADWCIASLRKTLPIPEGGLLWSPKGYQMPEAPSISEENEKMAIIRWEAMRLKSDYLAGEDIKKAAFRTGYLSTDIFFDTAPVSSIDRGSLDYLHSFNIYEWYQKKRNNWEVLSQIHKKGVRVLYPENAGGYPFSLVIVFDDLSERDRVRRELINRQVYTAVLWDVPSPTEGEIFKMSRGILSIHCDGRYTKEDTQRLRSIIESALKL